MNKEIYIPQILLDRLEERLAPGKVVVIYGPRRVGKTTLLRHFVSRRPEPSLVVTGEDIVVREYLESQSVAKLRAFVGNASLLVVDEAQHAREIGLNLKLLVDHVPGLRVVATGSSSFDLAQSAGEPLTGRKSTLLMLPPAQMEIGSLEAAHETRAALESRLIHGSYPEVVLMESQAERERYLRELVGAYLYKDILQYEDVRQPDKLGRLLQLLALQVGTEVSVTELGTSLGMSKNTVDRYLDLLAKVFVIYPRSGFSRNLRKEVTKSRRYYFFDNGIRNALINRFAPLSMRDDVGALWENYVVTERTKRHLYLDEPVQSAFWRTYDGQEIDLIEEAKDGLRGYEMKWSPGRRRSPPGAWRSAYPEAGYRVIHRDNYLEFIGAAPPQDDEGR